MKDNIIIGNIQKRIAVFMFGFFFVSFTSIFAQVWESDVRLTNEPNTSSLSSIAVDEVGGTHVIWTDNRDGNEEIYYKRALPDPIIGSTEPSQGRHLVREPGTQNLHIVFQSNNDRVYYTFSSDGGSSWKFPVFLDSGKYPSVGLAYSPIGVAPIICVAYFPTYGITHLGYMWYDPMVGYWQNNDIPTSWDPGAPSLVTVGDSVFVAYRASSWALQSWYVF